MALIFFETFSNMQIGIIV